MLPLLLFGLGALVGAGLLVAALAAWLRSGVPGARMPVTCAHCLQRINTHVDEHYKCLACRDADTRLCVWCEPLERARHGHDGWAKYRAGRKGRGRKMLMLEAASGRTSQS